MGDPNFATMTYANDVDGDLIGNGIGHARANTPAHSTPFAYDARHRQTTTSAPAG